MKTDQLRRLPLWYLVMLLCCLISSVVLLCASIAARLTFGERSGEWWVALPLVAVDLIVTLIVAWMLQPPVWRWYHGRPG